VALIVKLFGGENGPVSLKSVISTGLKAGQQIEIGFEELFKLLVEEK
jgi:hypothetical protein